MQESGQIFLLYEAGLGFDVQIPSSVRLELFRALRKITTEQTEITEITEKTINENSVWAGFCEVSDIVAWFAKPYSRGPGYSELGFGFLAKILLLGRVKRLKPLLRFDIN